MSAVASPTEPASGPPNQRPLRLYSLSGGEAPTDLRDDLLRVARLPVEAMQKFWQVLTPSLADHIAPETEQLLDVFCSAYKVDDDDLARAIKGCRFLIREAARQDVVAAAVADDLDRLCPDDPIVKELVLAGYASAKELLRHEVVRAAISDHGKLLVSLRWRRDAIHATDSGAKLGMPLAQITLHYREGAETGRVTLQALPDMIVELRAACDRMLASEAR